MLERAQRSWHLTREAWEVLRQDRGLVLFPILSGLFSLVVTVSFVGPFFLARILDQMGRGWAGPWRAQPNLGPWHYMVLFVFYLVTYFIVVFFNSGLVFCVEKRLAGQRATVRDGLAAALANTGRIFQWALLSATVGVLLRMVEDRLNWLAGLIAALAGLAWSLATTFVVPVLVHDQVGPIEALKRSADAFRRAWGEAVIAHIGLGLAFTLLYLPIPVVLIGLGAVAIALAHSTPALAAGLFIGAALLCLVYGLALVILQNTLQSIFLTACYQYATTGAVPAPFTPEYVVAAWRPKRRQPAR
jgi:hypothetical protein